ncbi:MAG: hypothetical protein Q8N03_06050 [Ignavibacteria bacterium]|jgi:hypothetical protein|nr:hypothetical protein [Ignavibacteria bacterium]
MIVQSQKYSSLTVAFIFIYLKFFLISPFFHHHHSEELINHFDIVFHSHLFEARANDSDITSGVILDNPETEHNHFDQLNIQSFVFTSRNIYVSTDYITSTFNSIPDKFLNQCITKNFEKPSVIKYQQDKYVHSAANVSPPLA